MSPAANVEAIRSHAKAILAALPDEEPKGDIDAVLAQMRKLSRDVYAAPWYLGPVTEDEYGSEYQTLAAHAPPHYEEMVAQFYPGNHGTAPAELILLVMNNLEDILAAAERGRK